MHWTRSLTAAAAFCFACTICGAQSTTQMAPNSTVETGAANSQSIQQQKQLDQDNNTKKHHRKSKNSTMNGANSSQMNSTPGMNGTGSNMSPMTGTPGTAGTTTMPGTTGTPGTTTMPGTTTTPGATNTPH